jgi:hypothetical protein
MRPNHVISIVVVILASSLVCAASNPGAAGPRIINQLATLKVTNNNGNSFFGTSVGVSGDIIVVGAENQGKNRAGRSVCLCRSRQQLEASAELTASDAVAEAFVGDSVAISRAAPSSLGAPALYARKTPGVSMFLSNPQVAGPT